MGIKKGLGYSSLTKTIHLAKMKDEGNGVKVRVGYDAPEDVTNEACQMVFMLVRDEGGKIQWDLGDKIITLIATETIKEPKQ